MGVFTQEIEIAPLEGGSFEKLEALVDTGATYTCVPRSLLKRMGLAPLKSQTFLLADGRRVQYEIAWVRIRLGGGEGFTVCIFGEEGTQPLLGAVTLEEFGLGVDPVRKRLVPVAGYLV